MISKRFPWRIFWLSLLAQLAVFHVLYGALILVHNTEWQNNIVLLVWCSSLISTFIFIRPVYLLVISLKNQRAELHREREGSQAFLTSIQEGVASFDLNGVITFFNPKFGILFIKSGQSSKSVFFKDIFPQRELKDAVDKLLASGKPQGVTLKLPTVVDNVPRFFHVSLTPVLMQKYQEIYEVAAVFHDITEIKKAEQIRIEFVGNASHELRTPLTSIKGYVETIRDDIHHQRYDQVDRFITTVSRNVDRLIDLVGDLLNLSRLEAGTDLKTQVLSPMQISNAVIGELTLLALEKNILIKAKSNVNEFVADGQKIEQVLRNLLSNAVKYIPEGKEVRVIWEQHPEEVVLRVIDNGPGIPEEHHSRLFERFYRVDAGRSRETGGTGLGLAIAKHIVQSHGGVIEVKSKLGQGTEFICRFPQSLRR